MGDAPQKRAEDAKNEEQHQRVFKPERFVGNTNLKNADHVRSA